MGNSRFFRRLRHLSGIRQGQGKRLLAKYMLPRLRRGNGNLLMGIAWGVDIDQIDIFPIDKLLPIGNAFTPAQ